MARLRSFVLAGFGLLATACLAESTEREAQPTEASDALSATYFLTDAEAQAKTTRGDCRIAAGDMIFHRSQSEQAGAIAYLTKSELTHVGIVFQIRGAWQVYEAVGPVKVTPLETWIARGVGRKFSTSRFKEDLDADATKALFEAGKPFAGKPYDLLFTEGDDKIYCSELTVKMYERAQVTWAQVLWTRQFANLWTRVDTLAGWSGFMAELASPVDSADEKLVKRIMAARGVDAHEFASQALVAPVTLADESHSGGVFREACRFGTH